MSELTRWRVELYERRDGSSPVVEFIEKQSIRNQAKILAEFDDLAEFGLMPRGNKLKPLEGKLWELRFRGEDLHFRFIYFVQVRGVIVVLHGLAKKTRKTPKRELDIALRRMYDLLEHSDG
jgi:phage-related protein